jgi:saccharopine dehydrogenase-like NADP-dependent oxidoreductase
MAAASSRFCILIVGSTGVFGKRIAELLKRDGDLDLVVAGRTRATLDVQASKLSSTHGRLVRVAVLDANTVQESDLATLGVRLVINASGPYQDGHYGLARAAMGAGCHYIDLADARAFVTGFGQLDDAARAARVLAVSGASSVPGLSSAVVAHYRGAFDRLDALDIAISPGNAFDPGMATVASVLGGVGQPMRMLLDGEWRTVHGWQGLRRQSFGEIGSRWLGYVDVPDLDLFPAREPGLKAARFQAGLEVPAFHLGLWAASWLVRGGLVGSLAPMAPRMLAIQRALRGLGSDRGGMAVEMRGVGKNGKPKVLRWQLTAKSGDGPYVPTLASVALAKSLASGAETRRGAMPCHGVVGLKDILDVAQGLDITCITNEEALPP